MGRVFSVRGWSDREVTVRRLELLDVLHKNREQHIKDYKEACTGYRVKAILRIDEICAELKGKSAGLREGQVLGFDNLAFGLDMPVSYEDAYDQVIRMMEMEVETTVKLTASQFACFVMDDWDWSETFKTTNSRYLGK